MKLKQRAACAVIVAALTVLLLAGTSATALADSWSLTGNAGTIPGTNFLGTTDNTALEVKVSGRRALRLEPADDAGRFAPNVIGGHASNTAASGVAGATIGGGYTNWTSGDYATVAGGLFNNAYHDASVGGGSTNVAKGDASTIAGGSSNAANGPYSVVGGGVQNATVRLYSAVAGGAGNTAAGDSSTVAGGNSNTAGSYSATVAGGYSNTANGTYSSVAGGGSNMATGTFSTVPGGAQNKAGGAYSFAAGRQAKAIYNGSFVWADDRPFNVQSFGLNMFTARATGGVRFISAISSTTGAATAGVNLAAGGGSWSSLSDRDLKRGFDPVDRLVLLRRLDRVPIKRWSYKAQRPAVRHLGPTAQDFYSAFGLGEDRRHITTVDADGVALAAIQGLYRQNQALRSRLAKLERKVAELSR
jgi:hypothetical protein